MIKKHLAFLGLQGPGIELLKQITHPSADAKIDFYSFSPEDSQSRVTDLFSSFGSDTIVIHIKEDYAAILQEGDMKSIMGAYRIDKTICEARASCRGWFELYAPFKVESVRELFQWLILPEPKVDSFEKTALAEKFSGSPRLSTDPTVHSYRCRQMFLGNEKFLPEFHAEDYLDYPSFCNVNENSRMENLSIGEKSEVNIFILDVLADHPQTKKILIDCESSFAKPVLIVVYSRLALLREYLASPSYQRFIKLGYVLFWPRKHFGPIFQKSISDLRSTLYYRNPIFAHNDPNFYQQIFNHLLAFSQRAPKILVEAKEKINAYYESIEFKDRLQKIREGTIKPKIYVGQACASVSVKKFSRNLAASFLKLGYETFIHPSCPPSNVDGIGAKYLEVAHLLPDLVIESPNYHKRRLDGLTNKIPYLFCLQDHIPHVNALKEFKDGLSLGPYDLLISVLDSFHEDLKLCSTNKTQKKGCGFRLDQLRHYYLPHNEIQFPADQHIAHHHKPKYEVGFVKSMLQERTLLDCVRRYAREPSQETKGEIHRIETVIRHNVESDLYVSLNERMLLGLGDALTTFEHAIKCRHYIEALANHGTTLALYGKHWDTIPLLDKFAHGHLEDPIAYTRQFTENRINLSLNPYTTFHPRILDGGQVGAFFLVNAIPKAIDINPMPSFLKAGTHYDTFTTTADLLKKVDFYLNHPDKCLEIGHNLKKTVRERFSYEEFCEGIASWFQESISHAFNNSTMSDLRR
jgi:hypothetical protein